MPRGARNVQTPGGQPETASPSTDTAATTPSTPSDTAAPTADTESADDEAYRERARTLRAQDVDATRLKRAVLTLDGWVCPATVQAPPAKE